MALYKKGPKAYLTSVDLGKGYALMLPEALMSIERGGAEVRRVCRLGEAVWVPCPRRLCASSIPYLLVAEHGFFVRPFADLFIVPLCELLAVITLGAFPDRPTLTPCAEPPLNAHVGVPDSSYYTRAL